MGNSSEHIKQQAKSQYRIQTTNAYWLNVSTSSGLRIKEGISISFILSSFYSKTFTATDDTPFRLEDDPTIVLASCNIHAFTNDAYNGTASCLAGVIRANAVKWFDSPVRVCDLVFKNYTGGSNTTIVIEGPVLGAG